MARIGELLVAAGKITPAQLEEGLRAQVLYGGRLGTNLVELFHLDLDAIALALARQQGIPAALGKHFERCDVTVQARIPAVIAERLSVVPIGRLADRRERIAIASSDRLPPDALDDLATFFRTTPDALVMSIAAELRIRYYLERAYGIARPSRYLRVRRETQHEIPIPDPLLDVEVEVDDGPADEEPSVVHTPTGQIPRRAPPRGDTDDEPTREFAASKLLDDTPEPPEIEIDPTVERLLIADKRRRFVRTLSDADVEISEPAPGEPDAPAPPPAPAVADAAWTDNTLARIAIRKAPTQAARPDVAELRSLDDANRAIRRASTREKVGDLMVRAAMTLTAGGIDAALVFVVREPIAIGWKGEVRDATPAVDAIAVPLDEPNAVAPAPSCASSRPRPSSIASWSPRSAAPSPIAQSSRRS